MPSASPHTRVATLTEEIYRDVNVPELKLGRGGGSGLAFGHGIPPLALAEKPDDLIWRNSIPLRGLPRLPVRLAG